MPGPRQHVPAATCLVRLYPAARTRDDDHLSELSSTYGVRPPRPPAPHFDCVQRTKGTLSMSGAEAASRVAQAQFTEALALHQSGRLGGAERLYLAILSAN